MSDIAEDGFAVGRICANVNCSTWITDENYAYGWCPECCGGGKCRHGDRPEDCNECAKESDRAFDESRERRMFE